MTAADRALEHHEGEHNDAPDLECPVCRSEAEALGLTAEVKAARDLNRLNASRQREQRRSQGYR
jgi:hypothetical protein